MPGEHATHRASLRLLAAWYLPSAHMPMQVALAAMVLNRPALQAMHCALLLYGENVPTAHSEHLDELVASANFPATHATQKLLTRAPL